MTDELWIRTAQVVGVDFPQRTIELVVIPYETRAQVMFDGRPVTEMIARGAFNGVEKRPNRVKVNRDHDLTRTIGKAVAFHPSRTEGLVAEVQLTPGVTLADETLALAADDCLAASAGFAPYAGGLRWDTRDAYTVTKAFLGHIAMTPDPAYDGARVLNVRSAQHEPPRPSGTPNLDQVRAWRLTDRVGSDPLYR